MFFSRRDHSEASTEDEIMSQNLAPQVDFPYSVRELTSTSATVQIGDRVEYVNFHQLAPAPVQLL